MSISKSRVIDFDLEIGRRVRLHRMRRGMKQGDLGRAIRASYQQVQKYENGTNRISAGKLVQIADALRIPLALFYEGLGSRPIDSGARVANAGYRKVQAFAATAQGSRLCRAFMQIENPATRRHFLGVLESISQDNGD